MSQQDDINGLFPQTIHIPSGATNCVLFETMSRQVAGVLEYVSGGTLWILGITIGQTLSPAAAASLFAGGTNIFLVRDGRSLNIDGWPRFYLASTGATSTIQILRGLGPGSYT